MKANRGAQQGCGSEGWLRQRKAFLFSLTLVLGWCGGGMSFVAHAQDKQDKGDFDFDFSEEDPPEVKSASADEDGSAAPEENSYPFADEELPPGWDKPEQDESEAKPSNKESEPAKPVEMGRYVQRPLTLKKNRVRLDMGPADFALLKNKRGLFFTDRANNLDVETFLGFGAALGVTDDLELGTIFAPLHLSPRFEYGDMEFYGRYRVLDSDFQLGLQLGVALPMLGDFGILFGVPWRFYISKIAHVEGGLQLSLYINSARAAVGLALPLALNINIVADWFAGLRTGFRIDDMDAADFFAVPFGIQTGYSLVSGSVDLMAWFEWSSFLQPAVPAGFDAVNTKYWQLGLGATFRADVQWPD